MKEAVNAGRDKPLVALCIKGLRQDDASPVIHSSEMKGLAVGGWGNCRAFRRKATQIQRGARLDRVAGCIRSFVSDCVDPTCGFSFNSASRNDPIVGSQTDRLDFIQLVISSRGLGD